VAVGSPDHRTGTTTDHACGNASITHASIFRERACPRADTPDIDGISRTLAGLPTLVSSTRLER
jgi:hypothetical protein